MGGLELFWKKRDNKAQKNVKHFYVNMTFPELWLLVSSLFHCCSLGELYGFSMSFIVVKFN
jgi:hypothetical protein